MSRKKLFALLLGTCLLISGTAYALSSSDFATKAQSWASTNCNNPAGATNVRALQCYLWHKSAEQQSTINNLDAKTKKLLTFDANGNNFGLTVSTYKGATNNVGNEYVAQTYDTAGGYLIDIKSTGSIGLQLPTYYITTDCSGSPYLTGQVDRDQYDHLIKGYDDNFYVISSPTNLQLNIKSQRNAGGCNAFNWDNGVALRVVSPTAPSTAAFPLEYRYE